MDNLSNLLTESQNLQRCLSISAVNISAEITHRIALSLSRSLGNASCRRKRHRSLLPLSFREHSCQHVFSTAQLSLLTSEFQSESPQVKWHEDKWRRSRAISTFKQTYSHPLKSGCSFRHQSSDVRQSKGSRLSCFFFFFLKHERACACVCCPPGWWERRKPFNCLLQKLSFECPCIQLQQDHCSISARVSVCDMTESWHCLGQVWRISLLCHDVIMLNLNKER